MSHNNSQMSNWKIRVATDERKNDSKRAVAQLIPTKLFRSVCEGVRFYLVRGQILQESSVN